MKRLVLLLVLVTAGCAPWVKTDSPVTSGALEFQVDPPPGWMRRNSDKLFVITRDGLSLQTVVIARIKVSDEKQFKYTKRRVSAGMLPQEVAEVVLDDFQSDTAHPVDAVEENAPAEISGKPGCRLRLLYSTKGGLKYRCEIHAVLVGDWLYRIAYTAPVRYYFDRDLPAVQTMLKSFRLTRL